jgi:protein-S-isoprenylcysteine O-methyltransferase Ste14
MVRRLVQESKGNPCTVQPLFGLGFLLHSVSLVFVWAPVFVVVNLIELRLVEEPELERRFGKSYREYRRRVPMFVPRMPGGSE